MRKPFLTNRYGKSVAFSLVEVVLAIGVISLAVVAMLGLFGPTMGSVKQVVDSNRADVLDGLIRSKLNEDGTYNFTAIQTELGANNTMYFYAWERYGDSDGDGQSEYYPVITEVSTSLATAVADTNSDGTTDTTLAGDLGNINGNPYVVSFERITLGGGGYDYANAANEGYIPFLVKVYQIETSQVGTITPADLDETNLVMSFPAAKLR